MTQPGAREHLRSVVQRIAHEWGYRFFKMDGLWTGTATRLMYVNDGYQDDQIGESQLHDPDKTQIEAYRDGLKLVREAAGPDVFLLGCCVSQNMRSFGGSFGLVDAMRIGPDTGAGHIGAPHGSRNYFLHGRVWQNDPDCVSVRASTPLDQARLNASWTAISGQLFYNSDWLPELAGRAAGDPAAHDARPWPVAAAGGSVRERSGPHLAAHRHAPRRAATSWRCTTGTSSRPTTVTCATERLGLPPAAEYVAFDFWADKFVPPFRETLTAELPAASCRVLAVRPVADRPQLLSTSRHVTQGIVDVLDENWDAASRTLSGTSRVVGGDPYELRIVVPGGDNAWAVREVSVSSEDIAAGVNTSCQQDGPQIRARVTSPVDREVHWSVKFASELDRLAEIRDSRFAVREPSSSDHRAIVSDRSSSSHYATRTSYVQPIADHYSAGSDSHPGAVPGELSPGAMLTGPKGTLQLRSGRCMAAELIARIRASQRFAEPLLLGPRQWYEGKVDCEISHVEGTMIQTLRHLTDIMQEPIQRLATDRGHPLRHSAFERRFSADCWTRTTHRMPMRCSGGR